jgi:GNAT superfamily N-acetyltransferase
LANPENVGDSGNTDDSDDADDSDNTGGSDDMDDEDMLDELDEYREFDDAWDDDDSNIASEDDEFAEFRWMEQMDGIATLNGQQKPDQIGCCNCKLIRRSGMRSIFYYELEQPSVETSRLAFDLFDCYGRLRNEFKTHPTKSGSGLWQRELDNGDLLLVEYIRIDKRYRGQGLGKRLVEAMLEMARKKSRSFFAVVAPGVLSRDIEMEMPAGMSYEERLVIHSRAYDLATNFFRSLGFRRVGSTRWYALASDPAHPCHAVPADSDYNPPDTGFGIAECEYDARRSSVHTLPEVLSTKDLDDQQFLDMVKETLGNRRASDSGWQATGDNGNTVLHVAAERSKPKSVEWILSQFPELLNVRNTRGETPLDTLQFRLEKDRTRFGPSHMLVIRHISDNFKGYGDESVDCLVRLKGLANPSQLDMMRVKYGCTCGQCVMGILSPRMCLALESHGEMQHDMLLDSADSADDWSFYAEDGITLKFVPPKVRQNMMTNKSLRQGFAELCQYFSDSIKNGRAPTEKNVLREWEAASEWPPVTRNYFQRDGTVYAVGSSLFQMAMAQDLLAGDGTFYDICEAQIKALPECRNDHEFGFASSMCGYYRVRLIQPVCALTGEPIEDD